MIWLLGVCIWFGLVTAKFDISWSNFTLPSLPPIVITNSSYPDTWIKLVADATGNYLVAASRQCIFYSDDEGRNWHQSQGFGPINMTWADIASSTNGLQVFAAATSDENGYSCVFYSSDRGKSFERLWTTGLNSTRYYQIFPLNSDEYIYGYTQIYEDSITGGITTRKISNYLNSTSLLTVTFTSFLTMAVSTDGTVVYYSNFIKIYPFERGYISSFIKDFSQNIYYYQTDHVPDILACSGDGRYAVGVKSYSGHLVSSFNYGKQYSWTEKTFSYYEWKSLGMDRSGSILFAVVVDKNDVDTNKLIYSSSNGLQWKTWAIPDNQGYLFGEYSLLFVSYTGKYLFLLPNTSSSGVMRGISDTCAAGQFLNATGQCEYCGKGTYIGVNDTFCNPCPPGSYSNAIGSANCWPCPLGYVTSAYGSITCSICPVGTASLSYTNPTNCTTCGYGYFSNTPASFKCTECSVGRYGIREGVNESLACADCPEGTYTPLKGQRNCLKNFDLFRNESFPLYKWVNFSANFDSNWVKIAVDDSGINMVAINESHIFYSTDGGFQWSVSSVFLYGTTVWKDIVFRDSEYVYAFYVSPSLSRTGTYISFDGGAHFYDHWHWSNTEISVNNMVPAYRSDKLFLTAISYHHLNGSFRSYVEMETTSKATHISTSYRNESYNAIAVSENSDTVYFVSTFHSKTILSNRRNVNPGEGIVWTSLPNRKSIYGYSTKKGLDMIVCSYDERRAVAVHRYSGELYYSSNYGQGDWVSVSTNFTWESIVMDRSGLLLFAIVQDRQDTNITKLVASYDGGVSWNNQNGAQYTIYPDTVMRLSASSNVLTLVSKSKKQVLIGRSWECPPGSFMSFNDSTSSFSCQPCPSGSASMYWNSTQCTECIAGTYAPTNGTAECMKCPPGYYSSLNGSTSCDPCPFGQRSILSLGSTGCVNCSIGTYTDDAGNEVCIDCPAGRYGGIPGSNLTLGCPKCPVGSYSSSPVSLSCTKCDPGHFQDEEGQTFCDPCPLNRYMPESGAEKCNKCPNGRLTNAIGQLDQGSCFSPYPNIIAGLMSAILSFFFAFVYIYNGEVNQLAYLREKALVSRLSGLCESVNTLIEGIITRHQVHREARHRLDHHSAPLWKRIFRVVFFWLAAFIFIVMGTISLYVRYVTHMLFMSMIVFRGVNVTIPFESLISSTVNRLFLNFHWPLFLYQPFVHAFSIVSSVKLNFKNVNVTCLGIQGPIQLLFNCIALIATVFVIAAKYQYFWNQFLSPLPGAVMRMFFIARKYRDMTFRDFLRLLLINGFVWSLCILNPFQRGLMYLMSLTTFHLFVDNHGLHSNTPGCDSQPGVKNVDKSLAALSSILAYLFLQPAIYTISIVLVPYLPPSMRLMEPNEGVQQEEKETAHLEASSSPTNSSKKSSKSTKREHHNTGIAVVFYSVFQTSTGRILQRMYKKVSTYLSIDLIMLEISRFFVWKLRSILQSDVSFSASNKTEQDLPLEELPNEALGIGATSEDQLKSLENDGVIHDIDGSRLDVLGDSRLPKNDDNSVNENNVEHDQTIANNQTEATVDIPSLVKHGISADVDGVADTATVWAILLTSELNDADINTTVHPSNADIEVAEECNSSIKNDDAKLFDDYRTRHVLPTFAELSAITYAYLCRFFFEIKVPSEPGKFATLAMMKELDNKQTAEIRGKKMITFYAFMIILVGSWYLIGGLAVLCFVLALLLGLVFLSFYLCFPDRNHFQTFQVYVLPALWLYVVVFPVYGLFTFILYLMSYTIFGHLTTLYGRQCWFFIVYNYWVFLMVSVGVWFDDFAFMMGVRDSSCSAKRKENKIYSAVKFCWRYCASYCPSFCLIQRTTKSVPEVTTIEATAHADIEVQEETVKIFESDKNSKNMVDNEIEKQQEERQASSKDRASLLNQVVSDTTIDAGNRYQSVQDNVSQILVDEPEVHDALKDESNSSMKTTPSADGIIPETEISLNISSFESNKDKEMPSVCIKDEPYPTKVVKKDRILTVKEESFQEDSSEDFDTDALSALIGIRAVLFQLSQTLAPVSVLVACWCGYPLFVFTQELNMPPMFAWDSWALAVADVKNETGFLWTIPFSALSNFVSTSRMIQFVLSAYPAVTATLVVLIGARFVSEDNDSQDKVHQFAMLMLNYIAVSYMILTIAVSLIESLEYVVYVGRFLDITDDYFFILKTVASTPSENISNKESSSETLSNKIDSSKVFPQP